MKFSRQLLPVAMPLLIATLFAAVSVPRPMVAQDSQTPTSDGVTQVPPTEEKPDPLKRRLTDKEKFQQQKAIRGELHGIYKKWVDEDVHWIITDQELQAFKSLSNDEERDTFIENFWLRRNPNPDSPENEYREEHYARIAYANEHFAAGKPGWRTDRGHIYIAYGKPDSIDSHPSGGSYERPHGRGRRRDVDLPVRDVALPVSRRDRRQHRHRVRGYLHVRRLPLRRSTARRRTL